MSVLPELILQRAIVDGFKSIRKDPRILNMLFKNHSLRQQEEIKAFILEKSIDFSINYPRTEIKVPAIVMLLKNETESQEFLGDVMGTPPYYGMPDQDMAVDTLGGSGASVAASVGLPPLVAGPLQVASMLPNNSAITFTEESQDEINAIFSEKPTWPCLKLYVVAGAGVGQIKLINTLTEVRLDIVDTFELELDSTSVVTIRYAEDPSGPGAYGEPVSAYENQSNLIRLGANYDEQYQLEILAGNQDEVIYLYSVLKAILFIQRAFLEAQGIMALKISGTDLAPRTELLPDEIFVRSMMLQFTYPFSFITEQEVVNAIQITLTSVNPHSREPEDQILVTEIEL